MASEIRFYGINETLFYLKNYEKELFDQLKTKLVDAARPLAQTVGRGFPQQTPLSRWKTSGSRVGEKRMPPYKANAASVRPIAGGSTRKTAKGGYAILRIQQSDAGGSVYDSAGRGNYESKGSTFIDNLDRKQFGKVIKRQDTRSRYMFKAVKDNESMVEDAILKVVKEVDGYTTKRINDPRS